MEPLQTPRKIFSLFCVHPPTEVGWKRIGSVVFTIATVISNICGLLATAVFFLKYVSIELEISLYGAFTVFGFAISIYTDLFIYFSRHKIHNVFVMLSKIYEANARLPSYRFLVEANNKSEKMWKFLLMKVILGILVTTFLFSFMSIGMCYFSTGSFNRYLVYIPFTYILPWNQSTLVGYIAEITCIVVTDEAYLLTNGAVLLLYISMCLHHRCFYDMSQYLLHESPTKIKNRRNLLCGVINFHTSVRSWFIESAESYRSLLMFQLISNNMSIACIVFHLKLELEHVSFDIRNLLTSASVGVLILVLYCHYGKVATDSFAKMAHCLYNYNWYELPVELQKYFILMIRSANRPVYYTGSGVSTLNMETCTKLLKMIYTCTPSHMEMNES